MVIASIVTRDLGLIEAMVRAGHIALVVDGTNAAKDRSRSASPVLPYDRGRRFQPNADAAALIYKDALRRNPAIGRTRSSNDSIGAILRSPLGATPGAASSTAAAASRRFQEQVPICDKLANLGMFVRLTLHLSVPLRFDRTDDDVRYRRCAVCLLTYQTPSSCVGDDEVGSLGQKLPLESGAD
jgi:hypothetical protein